MEVEKTGIPEVLVFTPRLFRDGRGILTETYNRRVFDGIGLGLDFVQDNQSRSLKAGTVRGLHFQTPPSAQAKLVRCVRGSIYDVAVDIRVGSPTFGRFVGAELTEDNWKQMLVPVGFAHGFCTITDDVEVCYKVSGYYDPEAEAGVAWDDEDIGIAWPLEGEAVLSDKDRVLPRLTDCPEYFRYEG